MSLEEASQKASKAEEMDCASCGDEESDGQGDANGEEPESKLCLREKGTGSPLDANITSMDTRQLKDFINALGFNSNDCLDKHDLLARAKELIEGLNTSNPESSSVVMPEPMPDCTESAALDAEGDRKGPTINPRRADHTIAGLHQAASTVNSVPADNDDDWEQPAIGLRPSPHQRAQRAMAQLPMIDMDLD